MINYKIERKRRLKKNERTWSAWILGHRGLFLTNKQKKRLWTHFGSLCALYNNISSLWVGFSMDWWAGFEFYYEFLVLGRIYVVTIGLYVEWRSVLKPASYPNLQPRGYPDLLLKINSLTYSLMALPFSKCNVELEFVPVP